MGGGGERREEGREEGREEERCYSCTYEMPLTGRWAGTQDEVNLIPQKYNGENTSPVILGECFQGCNVEIAFIVELSLGAKGIEVEFFHFP